MKPLRNFGRFWYDFIVGDDWRIAAGVVIGLSATAILWQTARVAAWWLLPTLVITLLSASLWFTTRKK